MRPLTKEQLSTLRTQLSELRSLFLKQRGTCMQLFGHPEATDAQIADAARKLAATRKALNTSIDQVTEYLNRTRDYYKASTFDSIRVP